MPNGGISELPRRNWVADCEDHLHGPSCLQSSPLLSPKGDAAESEKETPFWASRFVDMSKSQLGETSPVCSGQAAGSAKRSAQSGWGTGWRRCDWGIRREVKSPSGLPYLDSHRLRAWRR